MKQYIIMFLLLTNQLIATQKEFTPEEQELFAKICDSFLPHYYKKMHLYELDQDHPDFEIICKIHKQDFKRHKPATNYERQKRSSRQQILALIASTLLRINQEEKIMRNQIINQEKSVDLIQNFWQWVHQEFMRIEQSENYKLVTEEEYCRNLIIVAFKNLNTIIESKLKEHHNFVLLEITKRMIIEIELQVIQKEFFLRKQQFLKKEKTVCSGCFCK